MPVRGSRSSARSSASAARTQASAIARPSSPEFADRGLSPKSRRNVLGACRGFLGWLRRPGEIRAIPEVPMPRAVEYEPRILRIEDQDRILEAIPEARRGIFLPLSHLELQPGEARAPEVADYRDGWVVVDKAVKDSGARSPVRGTKTGRAKRLPVGPVLADWIERWVDPRGRLTGAVLFPNPRTGPALVALGPAGRLGHTDARSTGATHACPRRRW